MISRSFITWLILPLILIFAAHVYTPGDRPELETEIANKISSRLQNNVTLAEDLIKEGHDKNTKYYKELFDEHGITLVHYRDDSLIWWSNNKIPFEEIHPNSLTNKQLVEIKGSLVYILVNNKGNEKAAALILIRRTYPFSNEHLKTGFHDSYKVNEELSISKNGAPVKNKEGSMLFNISLKNYAKANQLGLLLGLTGYLLLILACIYFISGMEIKRHAILKVSSGIILLLIIRTVSILTGFPSGLYDHKIFSPEIFAYSSSIPSLGDLFLNLCSVFTIIYLFYKLFSSPKTGIKIKFLRLNVIILAGHLAFQATERLVTHSSISFSLDNFLNLTEYSFYGLLIITAAFGSVYMISTTLKQYEIKKEEILLALVTYFILFSLSDLNNINTWISILWTIPVIIIIYNQKSSVLRLGTFIIIISLFAAVSGYSLFQGSLKKEKASLEILSSRLSDEQDPIAEYLLDNNLDKIKNDTILKKLARNFWDNHQVVDKYLRDTYFSGYWEKYDIITTSCNQHDLLFLEQKAIEVPCLSFFDSLIKFNSKIIFSGELYFLSSNTGRSTYLATIKSFPDPSSTFFIEFHSRLINEGIGYPELLVDKATESVAGLRIADYSYASFHDGELTSRAGDFAYPGTDQLFKSSLNKTISYDGFKHFIFGRDTATTIVLSRREYKILSVLSYFSYILILFFISTGFLILGRRILRGSEKIHLSLKKRIQYALLLTLGITLLFSGAGIIYYLSGQYRTKNENTLREKSYSILLELDEKFGTQKKLDNAISEKATFQLTKLSGIFFSDINLFNEQGKLMASSREEIFDKGLVSERMNRKAFDEMHDNRRAIFIHEESIGNLNYLSAYMPFRNFENKVIGYINLPYFSRQSTLQSEISAFLVTMINIYVFILGLILIIAVFVSNRVTAPLAMIREKMSKLSVSSNETIQWNEPDEIGELVQVYNKMVKELEQNINELSRNQRETAWREMARQVAHEIRNPLTPMKLKVQHLQRSFDPTDPNIREKIKNVSETLIEQIDLLNSITEEFHAFARMPEGKMQRIDLSEVMAHSAGLFEESGHVRINFINEAGQAFIIADHDQFLRVFSNLIKNSIQAIPDSHEGIVTLRLIRENEYYIASISDNGTGIDESFIKTLFTPNFTTKSSGMGLGLAMVKRIIENSGGSISFKTETDKGTAFYIRIKAAD